MTSIVSAVAVLAAAWAIVRSWRSMRRRRRRAARRRRRDLESQRNWRIAEWLWSGRRRRRIAFQPVDVANPADELT